MKYLFTLTVLLLSGCAAYTQADLNVNLINYLSNQPVEGAEVVLLNESRGIEQSRITDARGVAVFRGLPEVEGYQVVFEGDGQFEAGNSEAFSIRSNQNPTVQLNLLEKREVNLDEVVVLGAASTARINRTDAEVAFELKQKEIEAIPIEGRDITRVLYRLPNVSQATGFYPEAPNVSINGANSLFTSYMIDGMDNNERFLGGQKFAIPVGFTRNITVLTNNYSAEYGLTANGVVNITTRSGSNKFGGEAFLISRPGPAIDGKSDFAQRDLSGNAVKDGFQRYQAGVGFGGAIARDQTFYYLNVEHTTDLKDNFLNSPLLGAAETVRGENNFTYFSGKLDHNWSPRFRSSLRANLGLVNIERQGGGLEGGATFPSAGSVQDRNSILVALKNSYIGSNFSTQTNLQYSRFRWNYGRPLNGDGPQATVLGPDEQTLAILGHPGYVFDETENTLQFQQKFNYYAGRHILKAGAGIISADHQLFGGGNANGNYTVKLTEDQLEEVRSLNRGAVLNVNDIPSDAEVLGYSVELRPASFGARQAIYSFYLEDELRASSRLNLILGLRYDYDNLSKGGAEQGDFNNIAPRFNFNYQLGQRSSLRGGYGIFYDKIPYTVYSDALQQNTTAQDYKKQLQELVSLGILPADTDIDRITFNGNLSGFASDAEYLNGPSSDALQDQREGVFSNERRILNPNGYDNPYTHQFALGYQLQMNEKSLFYLDLVHNQSYNLFRLRNLNAAAPFPVGPGNIRVRTPGQADASRPIPIAGGSYAVINGEELSGVARSVVVSETEGRSRYYAASFNFQKDRGEDDYALRINYTLSYLENNTEDINFRAMDANNFEAEWGPSINDRRHILNGIFSYYPIEQLSVTVAGLIQSGQPVNRTPLPVAYTVLDASGQPLQEQLLGPDGTPAFDGAGNPILVDVTVTTTDLNGDGSSFGDAYVGNSDRYPGESRNSDRLPWSNTFDLGVQCRIPFGKSELELRADVFNVFNTLNLSGYSNNATQSNQIQPGPSSSPSVLVRRNASAPRQFQFSLRYVF
ncbi:MAG: TonB-dependent receptor [Lewinellaceae bacterium]|nr:TonB-dependent receptor [Phaeodactylibacter sp.]MCB9042064.1 TonB-dependent receptor [Lewinellaceae bacterium]